MPVCKQCSGPVIASLRGRTKVFCGDRCRWAFHRGSSITRMRPGPELAPTPAPQPPVLDLVAWHAWATGLSETYVIDHTRARIVGLILDTAARYCHARDVLDRDGLTTTRDGRTFPPT